MVDWDEFRAGLSETRQYLLSHHHHSEWYRCYAPIVAGRQLHVCARCSGIYPGILAGLLAYAYGPTGYSRLALVAVAPLPALLDWVATNFTRRRGVNALRTATGGLLGFAYGIGLGLLLVDVDLRVLVVGIGYGAAAGGLLLARQSLEDRQDRHDGTGPSRVE